MTMWPPPFRPIPRPLDLDQCPSERPADSIARRPSPSNDHCPRIGKRALNTEDRSGLVVVVDDDAGMRESLKFLLETIGHSVVAFASAVDFLCARPERTACVVTDMFMPRMNGLELAGHLRAAGDTVPILLMTGAPSAAIVSAAAQVGIERVLKKPLPQEELLGWVRAHVGPETTPSPP